MGSLDTSHTSLLVEPVQACAACGTRLDVSASEPLHTFACPECSASFTVRARVGRFALVSRLGRGGTGLAYKAFDPDLKRHIAVKVLRRDLVQDAAVVAEMEKEASIMGGFRDANVVQVFTTGRNGDRVYIAMELIDGGSLDDRIRNEGRLPEGEVADIAIQIASGLAAARHAGLVHRDVKPGNILFTREGVAKIADFGLSVLERHAAEVATELKGTPHYVPPERVKGNVEDFRGDIYALGATLFHALAGRPVFEGTTGAEIVLKHLSNQAPSVLAFAPYVSHATGRVLARMLQKSPQARHGSYEELIADWQAVKSTFARAQGSARAAQMATAESERTLQRQMFITLGVIAGTLAIGAVLLFQFGRGKPAAGVDQNETTMSSPRPAKIPSAQDVLDEEIRKRNTERAAALEAAARAKPREVMLVDDSFPAGAKVFNVPTGRLPTWVTKAQGPVASGSRALRITGKAMAQDRYHEGAAPIEVPPGARFSVHVFIDPAEPPRAVMIQFHTDAWKHRAMWGDSPTLPGRPNTGDRFMAGPLPPKGRWTKLEVLAKDMNLKSGQLITGIALTQEGGTAYFDALSLVSIPEEATGSGRVLAK